MTLKSVFVEPALETYVQSIAGYQKNSHPRLPAELPQRVRRNCPRWFDQWGYVPGDSSVERAA